MSRAHLTLLIMGVTFLGMAAANLISIPRGPSLNCFKGTATYAARPSTYGIPFQYMSGGTSTSDCVRPVEHNMNFLPYDNRYLFHGAALLLDIATTLVLVGGIYLVGTYVGVEQPRLKERKV